MSSATYEAAIERNDGPRAPASRRTLPPLAELLENRQWIQSDDPFPHITAQNVFRDDFYQRLSQNFDHILGLGVEEAAAHGRFSRGIRGYDAYGFGFTDDFDGPLRVFISRAWHDLIAKIIGVTATGDVNSGLHHHAAGSENGRIHNDLNPGWFIEYDAPGGIRLAKHDLCCYKRGTLKVPGITAHETVRAVAIIYYLNNPAWTPGDGGETGLYRAIDDCVDRPVKAVPPLNNSLIIFECTPYSYHSFISNRSHPRNSVIMWLHRSKAEVVEKWGLHSIAKWPKE